MSREKITVKGIANVLPAIRRRHPEAWQEGSAGLSNSFFIKTATGNECVATSRPRANPRRYIDCETCVWIIEFGDPLLDIIESTSPPESAVTAEPEAYTDLKEDHRRIWLRVQKAHEKGKGLRLTAREVATMAATDFAEHPCISENTVSRY